MKFNFSDCPEDLSMIEYISNKNAFLQSAESKFTFYEIKLSDIGWPTADEILNSVLQTKNDIGNLEGWRKQQSESSYYKGFSLAYNSDFIDTERSIFFQSMGAFELEQSFSKSLSVARFKQIKNSYYDTYAFREISPLIANNFKSLFSKIAFSISRSRAAFLYGGEDCLPDKINLHKDEFSNQLLRVNIPLQTSEDYVLEINGTDENGNSNRMIKHLKKGYVYIWNTRIPHRVYCNSLTPFEKERIHLVLGLVPWFDFTDNYRAIASSKSYGHDIKQLIENYKFRI